MHCSRRFIALISGKVFALGHSLPEEQMILIESSLAPRS